ncbi:hypothetical protein [Larsenimonas rhizosphaerae]|uniref:Uncharacterized protein n=1 Tax=Larsenimonas rhizosphaerae TaxID=2944682 RepID=A0AA41ZEU0_9GAMM|nr:hypothetical protein [Larsenimonas rhizosphaerae]MCM2130808.1 hypothetical protein [Larsenimonas rhizosphaerae]MCX2523512.1 hypothetical protein [Larsenimonas rhizosphaerae]
MSEPSDSPPATLTRAVASFLKDSRLVVLPIAFDDSANWLWRSHELDAIIKMPRTPTCDGSFWQGMHALFQVNRWRDAPSRPELKAWLPPLPLEVLAMRYLGVVAERPLWALPWVEGDRVEWTSLTAQTLGHTLGQIHVATQGECVGDPVSADRQTSLSTWSARVIDFLKAMDGSPLPVTPLPPSVGTVMALPDMRPDQFLQGAQRLIWCDWEALVRAPIEFDWTLLELMVPSGMARQAFIAAYQQHMPVPSIRGHRAWYRRILHAMQVTGPCEYARVEEASVWIDLLSS